MVESAENLLIPAEFYFQATVEIPYVKTFQLEIRAEKHPTGLAELPVLVFQPASVPAPMTVRMGWNHEGLALDVEMQIAPSEAKATNSRALKPNGQAIHFFVDTRDLKTNRRTGKFCHHFQATPTTGSGAKKKPATLQVLPTHPGHQPETLEDAETQLVCTLQKQGYRLSCSLPAEWLYGYDPDNVPSLGFYYQIQDPVAGSWNFGIGSEFPTFSDPSLWQSLKLVR